MATGRSRTGWRRSFVRINESKTDRAIRVVVGVALLSLLLIGPLDGWGLVGLSGLVPLITGATGVCPTYALLGVDTLRGLETSVLGKTGSLGSRIKAIKDFPPEERGQVGKTVNEAKNRVKTLVKGRLDERQAKSAADETSEA